MRLQLLRFVAAVRFSNPSLNRFKISLDMIELVQSKSSLAFIEKSFS